LHACSVAKTFGREVSALAGGDWPSHDRASTQSPARLGHPPSAWLPHSGEIVLPLASQVGSVPSSGVIGDSWMPFGPTQRLTPNGMVDPPPGVTVLPPEWPRP